MLNWLIFKASGHEYEKTDINNDDLLRKDKGLSVNSENLVTNIEHGVIIDIANKCDKWAEFGVR